MNATQFGAVGDGITDDTVSLQALLNAVSSSGGDGVAEIPAGRFRITSPLHLDADDVIVQGHARTYIVVDQPDIDGLVIGNGLSCRNTVSVRDLCFVNSGPADTHTGGAFLKLDYTFNCFVERVRVYGAHTALLLNRCYESHVNGCILRQMTPGTGIGLRITGTCSDQYFTDVRIVGSPGSQNPMPAYGALIEQSSCVEMANVSTTACENGIAVKPALGNVVEFLFFDRVKADEGGEFGIILDGSMGSVRGVYGTDCWSSSNKGTGLLIQNCTDIKMSGMRCFNNLKHGFHLSSATDLTLSECTASGNGSFQHPNYHGIVIGNANKVKILGCRSGQTSQFGNHQGYGLFMASPFATKVLVDNCIFSGNITGERFLQGDFKLGQNY